MDRSSAQALLNSPRQAHEKKFYELSNGDYIVENVRALTCTKDDSTFRSVKVDAVLGDNFFTFFLPSALGKPITDDVIFIMNNSFVVMEKIGSRVNWRVDAKDSQKGELFN